MGFIKDSKANNMAGDARRALAEGRTIFVAQFRGAFSHTASLSRPIPGIAEMIEAVEAEGWHLDQFTAVPYKDNMTITGLFRRATPQAPMMPAQQQMAKAPVPPQQPYGAPGPVSWGVPPQQ